MHWITHNNLLEFFLPFCFLNELNCLGLVHWEDPEELGGEGGGRGDWGGEYMYIHGWFMSMYDKKHYNIVK